MNFSEYKINQSSFKSYDVRGIVPDELDASTAYAIAQAYVKLNPCKTIAIGYDHRDSTKELKEAFMAGLTDMGVNVWDIGQVTTDTTYFTSWHYKDQLDGAVMITASHLPAEYNGLKFITKELQPIGKGSGMEELYAYALEVKEQGATIKEGGAGSIEEKNVLPEYLAYLWSFIDKDKIKPLKVVMDCGNGVAGPMVQQVFEPLGLDIIEMYFEPDATFPNHEANPIIEENRQAIIAKVKEVGADLGIAWDADADRAYFIDENGEFIHGDFLTALLAKQFLQKNPGAHIVYDLRASNVVPDTVKAYGGIAHKQKVGHAHIKKMMREVDAVFAGEVSGHYYFKSNYYMDNGFIPPLMILQLLSESEKAMSAYIKELGEYYVSGEVNSKVEDANAVVTRLKETYADCQQDFLDGITVEYDDWRFNVRASNTEPVIRLNLEANSQELMEEKRDEVLALIRK